MRAINTVSDGGFAYKTFFQIQERVDQNPFGENQYLHTSIPTFQQIGITCSIIIQEVCIQIQSPH